MSHPTSNSWLKPALSILLLFGAIVAAKSYIDQQIAAIAPPKMIVVDMEQSVRAMQARNVPPREAAQRINALIDSLSSEGYLVFGRGVVLAAPDGVMAELNPEAVMATPLPGEEAAQ